MLDNTNVGGWEKSELRAPPQLRRPLGRCCRLRLQSKVKAGHEDDRTTSSERQDCRHRDGHDRQGVPALLRPRSYGNLQVNGHPIPGVRRHPVRALRLQGRDESGTIWPGPALPARSHWTRSVSSAMAPSTSAMSIATVTEQPRLHGTTRRFDVVCPLGASRQFVL